MTPVSIAFVVYLAGFLVVASVGSSSNADIEDVLGYAAAWPMILLVLVGKFAWRATIKAYKY